MKPAPSQPLSDFIQVGARFLRSVNLEKDYSGDQRNGDYIVTPSARQALSRIVEGLRENSSYRAWTITGPYGVGKSAFAVYLTRLFCLNGDSTHAARQQLRQVDPQLAQRLLGGKPLTFARKGFFPVLITGRRNSSSVCLLQGISHAVSASRERQFQTLARHLHHLLRRAERQNFLDSAAVVTALADVNSTAVRSGYSGVLLLLDELGKLFEFAARSPHKADVFVLQQLAEFASRSGDNPILLIGFLHQSFEDYGQHLDMASRKEWAKIQGRYEDVAFLEPADQVIRMIASAIRWKNPTASASLREPVAATARLAAECGIIPPGMRRQEFEAAALAAYPLHPTTLVALPFVFRRFAQNERSLFSYLSSLEPYGFQSFLQSTPLDVRHPHFVRLEHLFDYFTQNFGLGLFRQPQARRWMEAADVLDRKENLQSSHISLVKNIGILNALGEFSPLHARKPVIHFSITDTLVGSPDTLAGLNWLKDKSILTYRKFNDTLRIWEGSDVDLDEKVAEGERKTRATLSLSTILGRYLESRPLVARRHSYETGAMRLFYVTYVDDVETLSQSLNLKASSDGKAVVCLSASGSQIQEYREFSLSLKTGQDNLLIAIPQDIGEIRAAASELAALRWVWENTAELRDDRAARRELSVRLADAEQLLQANVHRLLDPREDPFGSSCLWFYQGVQWPVSQPVQVSHLLSHVCDRLFHSAPCIRNELIVRRCLSSQAAAARRNLVEAMLTCGAQPGLGITGFPPERSMYESALAATGIHAPTPAGEWHFIAPSKKHSTRLSPAWEHLSALIFQPRPDPLPLSQVFQSLAEPPYGVMEGLQPILLCAFMLVHSDEVTLYREGTFIPSPSIGEFETILRRPELFAIAGTRVQGARAEVVARLARGLGSKPATVPVVRAIFGMVRSLPELAWHTNRLAQDVKSFRLAFDNAKSPELFLFVDLPKALGLGPIPAGTLPVYQIDSLFDKLNQTLQKLRSVAPATLRQAQDQLIEACGLAGYPQPWQALREAAVRLEPYANHPELLSFLNRVRQSSKDESGIASVIELVANAPLSTWTDLDVDAFAGHARSVGLLFSEAETLYERQAYRTLISQLSPEQRRQAQTVQEQFEQFLAPAIRTTTPQIVHAALRAVIHRLQETKERPPQ